MRILLITNVFPNPWQPNKGPFNLQLARALSDDHQLRVISPVSWLTELRGNVTGAITSSRMVEHRNMRVYHPRYWYTPKVFRCCYTSFYWRSIRTSVDAALAGFSPDVVLGYWAHPDGAVALKVACDLGVPGIVMVGGSDILVLSRAGARRRLMRDVLTRASAVVAVSRDIADKVVEMGVERAHVRVVYRGVDTELFSHGDKAAARARLGISGSAPVLLCVGNLVRVKGIDVLLEAVAQVVQRGLPARLYVVGQGPLRSSLEARATALGLSSSVRFVGAVPQRMLPDWYRAADLTVLPSRSEGVPNVLRESMACGTPFIATRVGGIHEIAYDPDRQLVPPESPEALAHAIMGALQNDAAVPSGHSGSWDQSAAELLKILRQVARTAPIAAAEPLGSGRGTAMRC